MNELIVELTIVNPKLQIARCHYTVAMPSNCSAVLLITTTDLQLSTSKKAIFIEKNW